MELTDWLIFLHVLSAFVVVAALTVLWAIVIATRPAAALITGPDAARIGALAGPAVGGGLMGTLIFGIWLALDIDGYGIFDGWIIGAFVLWLLGGWAGGEAGKAFQRDAVRERAKAIRFQAINSAAVVVILILMIWKPGA